jgi:hypothetical protein
VIISQLFDDIEMPSDPGIIPPYHQTYPRRRFPCAPSGLFFSLFKKNDARY